MEAKAVPPSCRKFLVDWFPTLRKAGFYKDVSEMDSTIEAKFMVDKTRYSVEFDFDGTWLDTEKEIEVNYVPSEVWQILCPLYNERYERWRVDRVQEHRDRHGDFYYEVEIKTRKDFVWDRRQVRIKSNGTILEDSLIKLAPGHIDRW